MNLTLHLTPACNLRCTYCYAPPRPGPAISRETAFQALDLAERENAGRPCGIVLFGGEPLLARDRIEEILEEGERRRAAGRARFHYKVTTNGVLLDDAFLDLADRFRIAVALSFDGVREAHDRHRVGPDGSPTFDRLLPRLHALVARQPYATILLVVSPDTVDRYAESVTFLFDQGARYVVPSLDHGAPWDDDAIARLAVQVDRLADLYLAWTRAGRKFYFSPFEAAIATHVAGPEGRRVHHCSLGSRQLSVDPEGWIYPCVQFPRLGAPWRVGHVSTGLDLARRDALRARSDASKAACEGCALLGRCHATCGCLNVQATGVLEQAAPLLCASERIVIPAADRVAATLWAERNPTFLQKHYNRAFPLLSLLDDAARGAIRGGPAPASRRRGRPPAP